MPSEPPGEDSGDLQLALFSSPFEAGPAIAGAAAPAATFSKNVADGTKNGDIVLDKPDHNP
jgi:hypothetical protein